MTNVEQIKFSPEQKPQIQENQETPVVQESADDFWKRMAGQAGQEVSNFQKEGQKGLEAAETRAASEELVIDDADRNELNELNQEAENARGEFSGAIGEDKQAIPQVDTVKRNIENPPADYAGATRTKNREINESKQEKEAELQELHNSHEKAEKRLFGIGKLFGRKEREREIKVLLADINFLEQSDKENLRQAWNNFQNIQEDANRRELLLRNSYITKEQAETAPDDIIWKKLLELAEQVESDAEEAQKINRGIYESTLSISEAQSPQAKELLDRREEEILSHRYEERGSGDQERGDKLNWNHLAFIRRTDVLPIFDPESGRVYVHRPITDIKDYFNPHFDRPTTHWGLQRPAYDPNTFGGGGYGTEYIIFTDGKQMVEENGLPRSLYEEDTYWAHDLVLPKGSVIFTKKILDTQTMDLYKKSGVEITIIPENEDMRKIIEGFSQSKGYNPGLAKAGFDHSALQGLAQENGLRYGLHEGDESDAAVHRLADIIEIMKLYNSDDPSKIDRLYVKHFYGERLKGEKGWWSGDNQQIAGLAEEFSNKETQEIKSWLKKEIVIQYQDLVSFLRSRQHIAIFQEQLQKVESLMGPVIEKL